MMIIDDELLKDQVDAIKKEGNALYKKKSFEEAIAKYKEAFEYPTRRKYHASPIYQQYYMSRIGVY